MGCDIHMYLEQKVNGQWAMLDDYRSRTTYKWDGDTDSYKQADFYYPHGRQRNYGRFAALAGVRGDGPEPVGWPDDASPLAKFNRDYWDGDGHSHSWCSLANARLVFEGTGTCPGDVDPWDFYFGIPTDYVMREGVENFRLLFFFDN